MKGYSQELGNSPENILVVRITDNILKHCLNKKLCITNPMKADVYLAFREFNDLKDREKLL